MEKALDIKKILEENSITPNSSLGQNFVNSLYLLKREVNYADIKKNDIVLEIGPGLGQLTEILSKKARKVIAIEKDTNMKRVLDGIIENNPNTEIIYGDFLEYNIPPFDVALGNLPYNVALPIIFKLTEYNFRIAILMAQETLVRRIAAKKGQRGYCRLGVFLQRISKIKILEKVRGINFFPPSKVDSIIFSIEKTKPLFDVKNENFFMKVLKYMFYKTNRQTKFRENITNLKYKGISKKMISTIILKLPRKILDQKPYEISPEQFGKIADVMLAVMGSEKSLYKLNVDYRKKILR